MTRVTVATPSFVTVLLTALLAFSSTAHGKPAGDDRPAMGRFGQPAAGAADRFIHSACRHLAVDTPP